PFGFRTRSQVRVRGRTDTRRPRGSLRAQAVGANHPNPKNCWISPRTPLKKPCTGRGISWALLLSHLGRSVPDQAMGGGDIGRCGTVMSGQGGRALAVTGEEDLAPADPTVPSGFEGTRAVPVASEGRRHGVKHHRVLDRPTQHMRQDMLSGRVRRVRDRQNVARHEVTGTPGEWGEEFVEGIGEVGRGLGTGPGEGVAVHTVGVGVYLYVLCPCGRTPRGT